MKAAIFTFIFGLVIPFVTYGQSYQQYFEGSSTSLSIFYEPDTNNIWQVGEPQKNLFNRAATTPNAIVTQLKDSLRINDTSSFYFSFDPGNFYYGIQAIQWVQKLDMDSTGDWGIIEYSTDSGNTWLNMFDNPYVYNLYGFDDSNVDTLPDGGLAFTGVDTTWKNIWLCFDYSWTQTLDSSLILKYTFVTDSIDNGREGWMIDNIRIEETIFHTINEKREGEYLSVSPNPTRSRINIETRKVNEYHIIEEIVLTDISGRVVKRFEEVPTKFFLDISDQPNGVYFLRVKTNLEDNTVKVVLQR